MPKGSPIRWEMASAWCTPVKTRKGRRVPDKSHVRKNGRHSVAASATSPASGKSQVQVEWLAWGGIGSLGVESFSSSMD